MNGSISRDIPEKHVISYYTLKQLVLKMGSKIPHTLPRHKKGVPAFLSHQICQNKSEKGGHFQFNCPGRRFIRGIYCMFKRDIKNFLSYRKCYYALTL
jgi:hypothetical protein